MPRLEYYVGVLSNTKFTTYSKTGNIFILTQFSLTGEHFHSPFQCLLQL